MKTAAPTSTIEFLDLIKSLNNNATPYRISQLLDVKNPTVYRYYDGKGFFDDDVCEKVAELTGYPLEYVLAVVHAERAKSPSLRTAWTHIAEHFATAAAVLMAVGILAPSFPV